jgi:hypothetical protein
VGLTNKEVIKLNRRKTTMKLRNILITAATMGMMFASADRTSVLGYTEGDYSDMTTFPHMAAGQNVAYTMGNDFTAVWTDGGTTWGFSSGDAADLVNMKWSNGTFGLSVGLNMDSGATAAAEVLSTPDTFACDDATTAAVETTAACDDAVDYSAAVVGADAATNFDLGFGMNLAGWDVGFAYATVTEGDAPMSLNARGSLGFWAFDTATVSYASMGDNTVMDFGMYGVQDWGAATGYFGMGITMDDNEFAWHGGEMTINTDFSVESTLTDWCDLRIGYTKSFNMAAEGGSEESNDNFAAGLGFNYGSVQLDMIVTDNLNAMMSNPINFVTGRNSGLATQWTLSYSW